jgi:hypothetical protein
MIIFVIDWDLLIYIYQLKNQIIIKVEEKKTHSIVFIFDEKFENIIKKNITIIDGKFEWSDANYFKYLSSWKQLRESFFFKNTCNE